MTETLPGTTGLSDPQIRLATLREAVLDLLAGVPNPPSHVRMRIGDVSLELDWATAPQAAPQAAQTPQATPAAPSITPRLLTPAPVELNGVNGTAAPDSTPPASAHQVGSPSVGTFYRAPEPGATPFVAEGDSITKGQQIGIVETMKLMLPVESDRAGRVIAILADDGQGVEFGEALFALADEN